MIKTSTLTSIILLSLCFITSGCHNTNDKNKKSEGIPSLEYTVMQDRSTQQVRYGVLKPTTYYWNIMCNKIYFSDEYMILPENASNIISYRSKVPSAKEEWALNLKEDDNPCLYFYTWK